MWVTKLKECWFVQEPELSEEPQVGEVWPNCLKSCPKLCHSTKDVPWLGYFSSLVCNCILVHLAFGVLVIMKAISATQHKHQTLFTEYIAYILGSYECRVIPSLYIPLSNSMPLFLLLALQEDLHVFDVQYFRAYSHRFIRTRLHHMLMYLRYLTRSRSWDVLEEGCLHTSCSIEFHFMWWDSRSNWRGDDSIALFAIFHMWSRDRECCQHVANTFQTSLSRDLPVLPEKDMSALLLWFHCSSDATNGWWDCWTLNLVRAG